MCVGCVRVRVCMCVCVGGGLREIHVDKSRMAADGRWQENEGKFVHLGQRQGSLFK